MPQYVLWRNRCHLQLQQRGDQPALQPMPHGSCRGSCVWAGPLLAILLPRSGMVQAPRMALPHGGKSHRTQNAVTVRQRVCVGMTAHWDDCTRGLPYVRCSWGHAPDVHQMCGMQLAVCTDTSTSHTGLVARCLMQVSAPWYSCKQWISLETNSMARCPHFQPNCPSCPKRFYHETIWQVASPLIGVVDLQMGMHKQI